MDAAVAIIATDGNGYSKQSREKKIVNLDKVADILWAQLNHVRLFTFTFCMLYSYHVEKLLHQS